MVIKKDTLDQLLAGRDPRAVFAKAHGMGRVTMQPAELSAEDEATLTALQEEYDLRTNEWEGTVQARLAEVESEVERIEALRFAYKPEEVMGQHHSMFCDKEYVASPEYAEFWRELARGVPQVGEFERIRKDGRPIFIRAAYNPTFDLDGTICGVTKFATDITNARELKREADSMATSTAASIEQMTLSIADIARSMTTTKDSVDLASDSAKSIVGMIAELVAAGEKMCTRPA